jgi:hypothetical protein
MCGQIDTRSRPEQVLPGGINITGPLISRPTSSQDVRRRFFWKVFFRASTWNWITRPMPGWPDWANFRPTGDNLLWTVLENCRSSTHFWTTLFHGKRYTLIWTKMGWATFWAIFFANSSGHPGRYPEMVRMLSELKTESCSPIQCLPAG